MSASLDNFIRDLRAFDGRKEVIRSLKKTIREPVPVVRKSVRSRALETLPRRNGFAAWVAASRINVTTKINTTTIFVVLKGGRNSARGRSDLNRIDKGRLRHPAWGRRGLGQWHTQAVEPGFFTKPTTETDEWRKAILRGLDDALEVIKRG